jgi:hypothetical protein
MLTFSIAGCPWQVRLPHASDEQANCGIPRACVNFTEPRRPAGSEEAPVARRSTRGSAKPPRRPRGTTFNVVVGFLPSILSLYPILHPSY